MYHTFTPAEAESIPLALEGALPSSTREHWLDDGKALRGLQGCTHILSDEAAVLEAIRSCSDALLSATGALDVEAVRIDPDLVTVLRQLGWGSDRQGSSVRLGGIWGDVLLPGSLAVLAAIAPWCSDGESVFADRFGDPVCAYKLHAGNLFLTTEVETSYSY